jgi:predicted nuclease with RNAse H fold
MTDYPEAGSSGLFDILLDRIRSAGKRPLVVGIDLTGLERRPSGICVLDGRDANLSLVSSDREITRLAEVVGPAIISIDSSLGLPAGRCCVEDTCECRKYGIMRECERILRKRGIRVYPTLIRSMQQLTQRGIRLSRRFRDAGHPVIESYPGAAQDILRIPRKKVSPGQLEAGLRGMGLILHPDREPVTHDHLDALTSALVGYFYLAGLYEAIGNEREGYLILPDLTGLEISRKG